MPWAVLAICLLRCLNVLVAMWVTVLFLQITLMLSFLSLIAPFKFGSYSILLSNMCVLMVEVNILHILHLASLFLKKGRICNKIIISQNVLQIFLASKVCIVSAQCPNMPV
uniref:Uncharacterized protein n=1 Tax=Arundo donax TaxID=35708 RepID=A0A0A9FB29_ARUDO